MGFGSAPIQARTVVRQDAAPSNTDVLWLDTTTSPPTLKQYDSDGASWVSVAPSYVTAQATQPSEPVEGDLWVDTDSTPQRVYQYDGSTFNALANFAEFDSHATSTANPHNVSAGQVGAPTESEYDNHVADSAAHHVKPTSTQSGGERKFQYYQDWSLPNFYSSGDVRTDVQLTPLPWDGVSVDIVRTARNVDDNSSPSCGLKIELHSVTSGSWVEIYNDIVALPYLTEDTSATVWSGNVISCPVDYYDQFRVTITSYTNDPSNAGTEFTTFDYTPRVVYDTVHSHSI